MVQTAFSVFSRNYFFCLYFNIGIWGLPQFFFCVGILRFSAIISRNMYLAYVFRIIENILIMI